jgi:hypothetical protein
MSTLRTNAILDASGGNTATINTVPLRPGVLDPENRIINGAFDFWQRGTSFTGNGYGSDRWYNSLSGGTVTMSRQAFALGDTLGSNNPTYFLRQTVSGQTTSAQYARITHQIEGVRAYAGQTITVLGWAKRSSGSGNMAVEASQYFGSGGSPSSGVSDIGVTTVTLSGSYAPFAVTMSVPSISGKTLGTNNNDFLQLSIWTSAGSDYNARTNSLGLQTIGVDLWGVHIKVGTHTTAATDLYKQPELGPELARCQRYFQQTVGVTGSAVSTTNINILCPLTTTMRAAPAVSLAGLVQVTDGHTTNPLQSSANVTVNVSGTSHVYVNIGNFTGLNTTRVYFSGLNQSPFLCDAEL